MELKYMREMSPEEVYGYNWSVPAGHKEIGFYPPKCGDLFMSAGWDYSASECTADYKQDEPRLILRKKAKRRFLVLKREIGEDSVGFGLAQQIVGEQFAADVTSKYPELYSIVEEEC
jgi:hypothetical protein